MADTTCKNCGGDKAIHHYQTMQCPVGGREKMNGPDEYMTTTFQSCETFTEVMDAKFPIPNTSRTLSNITKRELFAAMAMQGLLANPNSEGTDKELAFAAVETADALLEELTK